MKLFNATMHDQEKIKGGFAEFGFSFAGGDTDGHGFLVKIDEKMPSIQERANEVVAQAIEAGAEGLLVGGLGSVTVALFIAASEAGLAVFEASTERLRDENDRSKFRFLGVRRIN